LIAILAGGITNLQAYSTDSESQVSSNVSNFNDLALATQRHQWSSLKYEIESIRAQSPIQGYTITEFTDLNWECNGLLDTYRNTKVYAPELARLQQQDVIFARLPEVNFASGERIDIPLYVSRFSKAAEERLTATAVLQGTKVGQVEVAASQRGQTTVTAPVSVRFQDNGTTCDQTADRTQSR
jgi:hypothetical protein